MVRLLSLPHSQSARLAASGVPVFLFVNPVEYHGPHLSLHNDRLVSEGLARHLHAALAADHPEWPLVVADDLELGVDPCPGPGTRETPFAVGREMIRRACASLAELGVKRVVVMTFHGSPLHAVAIQAGIRDLLAQGIRALSPLNIVMHAMASAEPGVVAPEFASLATTPERQELIAQLALDFHAGFFETSVALHLAPDSVDPAYVKLPPCPPLRTAPAFLMARRMAASLGRAALAGDLGVAGAGTAWYGLRPFPGYTGKPHLATAADGEVFVREIVRWYARETLAVFDGAPPPEPILGWTAAATLGGRIFKHGILPEHVLRPFESA